MLIVLALAGAPGAVLAVADSVRVYHRANAQAERDFMAGALAAAQRERDMLTGARHALEAVASMPAIRAATAPDASGSGAEADACDAALSAWIAASFRDGGAVAMDNEGRVRCASDPDARARDFRDDPGLAAVRREQRFAVTAGAENGARRIVLSTPILRDGALAGALSLSLRSALIETSPLVGPQFSTPGAIAVVDGDGATLLGAQVAADARATAHPANAALTPGALAARLTATPAVFHAEGDDGAALVLAVSPLVQGRAWMLASAPAATVERGVMLRALWPVAAPALMWLLAITVVYFTVERPISRRLETLKRLLRAYGRGRFALRPRAPEDASREIATLADDMGAMASKLAAREHALRRSAQDNQALLLEVYHRVRNNLQTIISMLGLEARRAEVPEEKAAIERIQSRIHSLALVQQTLLSVDAPHVVRLDALTAAISEHLVSTGLGRVGAAGDRVRLRARLAPAVASADRASPFALLIDEALANALRHGEGEAAGWLDVALETAADGTILVEIVNAAPTPPREQTPGALGMRMMRSFADQLGATLATHWEEGRFTLRVSIPPEEGDSVEGAAQAPSA